MKNHAAYLIVITAFAALFSSCGHNAVQPEEKITQSNYKPEPSVIFIPISVSNKALSVLIQSKLTNPVVNESKVVNIPVINYVTVPTLVTNKILVDGMCPFTERVRIGWKCLFCPSCCFTLVTVQKACKVEKVVTEWVNHNIINKINVDLPINYVINLNNVYFDGDNQTLNTHVILDFKVKADVPVAHVGLVSCGYNEPMAQIELTLISKVDMENDGKLSLSNKTWSIKWINACNLTALDINVEDLLNLPIIKSKVESKIDEFIQNKVPSNFDIKSQLQKNWPDLSKPVKIKNLGNLNLNISELSMKNIFVTNEQIQTNIGMICNPVFNLTDEDITLPDAPFPKLTVKNGNDSINVNITGSVTFETLNKYANDAIKNYKDKINGKNIEIGGISLYQHADSLVVGVELKKPFSGKVYLWGKPEFEEKSNTLTLKDLNYTIDSKKVIGKFANGLLHVPVIERSISKLFHYKYEKNLASGVNRIKNLNYQLASNIVLKASCTSVQPFRVLISANKINVFTNVRGQAMVQMN